APQPDPLRQPAQDSHLARGRADLLRVRRLRQRIPRDLLGRGLRPARRGADLAARALGARRPAAPPPSAAVRSRGVRVSLLGGRGASLRVVRRLVSAVSLRPDHAAVPGARGGALCRPAPTAGSAGTDWGPRPFDSRARAALDRRAGVDLQLRGRPHLSARSPRLAPRPRSRAALPQLDPAASCDLDLPRGDAARGGPGPVRTSPGRPTATNRTPGDRRPCRPARDRRRARSARGASLGGVSPADASGRIRGRAGREERRAPRPRTLGGRSHPLPRHLGAARRGADGGPGVAGRAQASPGAPRLFHPPPPGGSRGPGSGRWAAARHPPLSLRADLGSAHGRPRRLAGRRTPLDLAASPREPAAAGRNGERHAVRSGRAGLGMRVAAVVPTLGKSPLLEACLRALRAQGRPVEIVVVDQGERPVDLPPGLADQVIRPGRNLGFAAGTNLGSAATAAPYIATVNDDAIVEPGWLAALLEALEADPALAAAQGANLRLDRPEILDGLGIAWNRSRQAIQIGAGERAPDRSEPARSI